ncbi:uncharacterized protein LOC128681532 [Plodia interpunctella]|uniref:uncharacterized protein LOC128681532 n=1 Tax=Plodia interpunctella TaxID=58824 RepID=UPI002367C57D|nr:uncharacterized protein LOC128681532 [Plodia interpunctella]
MENSMQDITSIDSHDKMVNMIVTFSNNNNCTNAASSKETTLNIHENKNPYFDFDKVPNVDMSGFQEFDQVLSKYREEKVFDYNTQLQRTIETNSAEFLEISIAENVNKTRTFHDMYREYLKNCIGYDESHFETIKTELPDIISLSEDNLQALDDQCVDLDDISLASNNIFTFENSEFTNIEIEIDDNKVADSSEVLRNINSDANDFQDQLTNNEYRCTEEPNKNDEVDIDNNSDCSYHSSDFEVITEEEAKMDGLILNFRNDNKEHICNTNDANFIEMYLPHAHDEVYRDHKIPEGEDFYNLFRGLNAPANVPDIFLENKSVMPTQCMSVEKEALGFDLRILNKDTVVIDEGHQEEAKETARKILEAYGNNNRRRSRKFL